MDPTEEELMKNLSDGDIPDGIVPHTEIVQTADPTKEES